MVGAAGHPRGLVWAGPSRSVHTSIDPVQRDFPVYRWWPAGSVCWFRCRSACRGSRRGWWCRNPGVVGDALGQGQQPAQTPRDRVFAQGWVSEAAEFLQRGMAVVQPAGHRPPAGAPGRSRRGCAPPAEPGRCWPRRRPRRVPGWRRRGGQSVAGAAMLRPAPPTFLPAVPAFGGIHQGQQCPDGVFVPDQDAVRAANLPGFRGDPNRRAAPTRASAVSGPRQCTSKAGERSGSVSEPRARNAARHTAAASHVLSATTGAGSPRTGRPRGSSNPPVRRAKASPSVATCTTYRAPSTEHRAASTLG